MVTLGGVTRLTHSGLSMVNWAPIVGVIPPLSKKEWKQTFRKYKKFPEYKKINRGMSLGEFKSIFWFEYAHRLLGRLLALAFLIPFIYFLVRRRIPWKATPWLILMPILGGLQGVLGWYMVKSGLIDKPSVSPYRLTAHLALAGITYTYIFWFALRYWYWGKNKVVPAVRWPLLVAWGLIAIISVLILSGGFVAGTKAGLVFNTYPLMNGKFVPEGYMALQPLWRNFFENVATVQFNHRWLAAVVAIAILTFWFATRGKIPAADTNRAIHILVLMLVVQIGLGITTLLYHVPVVLGAAHQTGGIVLLTIALFIAFRLRPLQT